MRTLEIPGQSPNVVLFSPVFDAGISQRTLLLTGWDANPDGTASFQEELDSYIGSAAFSAFDLVDPIIGDFDLTRLSGTREYSARNLPPRNILRAERLHQIYADIRTEEKVLADQQGTERPQIGSVIAHCAGALSLLTAIEMADDRSPRLAFPRHLVLVEPMILQDRTLREVTRLTRDFHMPAKRDRRSGLIFLNEMKHPDAVNLGTKSQHPLNDILNGRGVELLRRAMYKGYAIDVVLGVDDVAAPTEETRDALDSVRGLIRIHAYPTQPERGHGFMIARHDISAPFIAGLINKQQKRQS
jgi:hypothetical protein